MKKEAIETVSRFFDNASYTVPWAMAHKIVGANNADVANWRNRKLLPFLPKKIGARNFCTRDGLFTLGIMAEISWLIGPDYASALAKQIWAAYLAQSPHGIKFDEFKDHIVTFRKPIVNSIDVTEKPRFPKDDEDQWSKIMGFPLEATTRKAMAANPVPSTTTVILPIGELFVKWAYSAQVQLDEAAE